LIKLFLAWKRLCRSYWGTGI